MLSGIFFLLFSISLFPACSFFRFLSFQSHCVSITYEQSADFQEEYYDWVQRIQNKASCVSIVLCTLIHGLGGTSNIPLLFQNFDDEIIKKCYFVIDNGLILFALICAIVHLPISKYMKWAEETMVIVEFLDAVRQVVNLFV